MNENMSETAKTFNKTAPIILKKDKIMNISNEYLLKCFQNRQINREDILYVAARNDDLFKEFPNLTITNTLNTLTNASRTIATYTENSSKIELNSDKITEFVGQNNYDFLLNAISSVFNQNLKIRAILALLKRKNQGGSVSEPKVRILKIDKTCQTDETYIDKFKLESRRKKRKQRFKAYVVQDNKTPKNDNIQKQQPLKRKLCIESGNTDASEQLIDTKLFIDEDSNISDTSIGNISLKSSQIPLIVENPQCILDIIEKYSQDFTETPLKFSDGSVVMLKMKPKDLFHIAIPENLRGLSVEDQKKLMLHQACIDWRYCLELDNDGNLYLMSMYESLDESGMEGMEHMEMHMERRPLHAAVLDNDVDFLRRQCFVLRSRQESLDVLGGGGMSALELSIHQSSPQCTAILLACGARVLQTDTEFRTVLHTAAGTSAACVRTILDHCSNNARKILMEEEDLTSELECMSDDELAKYLLNKLCSMYDNQGNTPLMQASSRGAPSATSELVRAAPDTVDIRMPTSGNTALYLTVSAAVAAAERAGNLSEISPDYLKTIEILSKNGADPNIVNDSGTSVTALLSEFKNSEIAQVFANKVLNCVEDKAFHSFMLVKNNDGDIKVEPVSFTKQPRIEVNNKSTPDEAQENRRFVIKKDTKSSKKLISFEIPPKNNRQINAVQSEIKTNNVTSKNETQVEIKTENVEWPKEKVIILQNIPITNNSLKIDKRLCKGDNINVKNNIPVKLKSQLVPRTSKVEDKTESTPNPIFIIEKINEPKKQLNTNRNITKINPNCSLQKIQNNNLFKFQQFIGKSDQNKTNVNKTINNTPSTSKVVIKMDQTNKFGNAKGPSANVIPVSLFNKPENKIGIPRTINKNSAKALINNTSKKGIKKFIVNIIDKRKNESTNATAVMVKKRVLLNSESGNIQAKKIRK